MLLFIALLCVIGTVAWGVICVEDYNTIAIDPASSGVDFLLIWMGYSIGFFCLSIVGFISSLITKQLNNSKNISIISLIGIILFLIEFLFAIYLFFM